MPNDTPSPATLDPAAIVDALARAARKHRTPCGDGSMVWRVWGEGEPLLLFHGGTGSWTHWIKTIPVLAPRFELWVPDTPGLGDSAMPPEPWTPRSIADAVAAGVDQLFPANTSLRLAGFSFGGHIAGLLAARRPDRFSRLILVGVAGLGLRADPRAPFAKARTGMSPAEVAAVYRQNLEVLMFADPRNIDPLAIHLQIENVRRARFRSRAFAATDELARALADVPAPLGTIWGTLDAIARPSLPARLDVLRRHHPELDVRLIEGSGHWVMYEAGEQFNAAFLELLQTQGIVP
jgi:2-hydroxy-6-oxonona-2,4-dienedioate hydrolase